MREHLVEVFHRTHDVARRLSFPIKPRSHATGIAHTFLSAIVGIECAVTSRLIGVAITFGEEAVASVATQHAKIAGISIHIVGRSV